MPYISDESGSFLKFTSPHRGPLLRKLNVLWGLLYLIVLVVIAGSFLSSFQILEDPNAWESLGCFGLFFLFAFLSTGVEFLWQVTGQEVLEIDYDAILIRHQIFGLGISRRYQAEKIAAIGVNENREKNAWLSLFKTRSYGFLYFEEGKVTLKYGQHWLSGRPKTSRFGTGLTWEEAEEIVSSIHQRFPQYMYEQGKR